MLHIAKQFIWYRKKNSCLLILVAGLCLALMLAIGLMFENAQDRIFHAYADRYGRHHGAMFFLKWLTMESASDAAENYARLV